jgi:hypothetical protein
MKRRKARSIFLSEWTKEALADIQLPKPSKITFQMIIEVELSNDRWKEFEAVNVP